MLLRPLLFALLAVLLPRMVSTKDGKSLLAHYDLANPAAKVVGGTEASSNVPYFILWGGCGATLIHNDIALSAAHCTYRERAQVGVRSRCDITTSTHVDTVARHPNFDDETYAYDFAVLKLSGWFDHRTVQLNGSDSTPSTSDQLTILGFGGQASSLMEGRVNYVSPSDCSSQWSEHGYAIDGQAVICAQNKELGVDACNGDSGGPLLYGWSGDTALQVGVVSSGSSGCNGKLPTIYSRVSTAIEWIEEQICELSALPPSGCSGSGKTGDNETRVRVDVIVDEYPEDIFWKITSNLVDGPAVASGGSNYRTENALESKFVDLKDGFMYFFTIEDQGGFGDGLGQNGSYKVVEVDSRGKDVTTLVSGGGNFGYAESKLFQIGDVPPTIAPSAINTTSPTPLPTNGTNPPTVPSQPTLTPTRTSDDEDDTDLPTKEPTPRPTTLPPAAAPKTTAPTDLPTGTPETPEPTDEAESDDEMHDNIEEEEFDDDDDDQRMLIERRAQEEATDDPTDTPTAGPIATATELPTTETPTPGPTFSPTIQPISSPPTPPEPTAGLSPSAEPTEEESETDFPSDFPSDSPSASVLPSFFPSVSVMPSISPSIPFDPTNTPTEIMSNAPSFTPTPPPIGTAAPSPQPSISGSPTATESVAPSDEASDSPSTFPTTLPTSSPTISPSPTVTASNAPTTTFQPTNAPTMSSPPTSNPTMAPTISVRPTISISPSINNGTFVPTVSSSPTGLAIEPTVSPTASPTASPTSAPTEVINQYLALCNILIIDDAQNIVWRIENASTGQSVFGYSNGWYEAPGTYTQFVNLQTGTWEFILSRTSTTANAIAEIGLVNTSTGAFESLGTVSLDGSNDETVSVIFSLE